MIHNIKGSEIITLDNKNIGKVTRIDKKNRDYFIVFKKGLFNDEEFHIPFEAIVQKSEDDNKIFLNLKESQLKHGHELIKKHRPSDLVKGKSYPTFANPFEKEIIRYEVFSTPKTRKKEKKEIPSKFLCDSCSEEFENGQNLEQHRMEVHFGPVGI
jgi:hypothetical protein